MSKRRFDPLSLREYMNYPRALKYSTGITGNISDFFSHLSEIQGDIFRGKNPNKWEKHEFLNNMNPRLGAFFELLSYQIFGGTLLGLKSLSKIDGFKPDIVDYSGNIIREVKSCKWGDSLKLTDHKIGEYALMQSYLNFLPEELRNSSSPFQIFFDCFKYNLTNPADLFMQRTKDKQELFNQIVNELSNEVSYLISLPFSIIWEVHNNSSRYDGSRYDSLSRFSSPLMQDLLTHPHKTLEEQLGINPDDYRIKKTRIPKTMEICRRPLKSFPVLTIKHRSAQQHKKWVDSFVEKNTCYLQNQNNITRDDLRYNVQKVNEELQSDGTYDEQTARAIVEQEDFFASLFGKGELLHPVEDNAEEVPF